MARPLAVALVPWLATLLVPWHAAAAKPPPSVVFSEHLISDDYTYAYGLGAADLDGDGDVDLTSADTTGHRVFWFENDGSGTFERHLVRDMGDGWPERHVVVDLDQNGTLDVVVVDHFNWSILWFENDGTPGGAPWDVHAVTAANMPHAYDVDVTDIDADGDLDVFASAYVGNELAWFENPGDPFVAEWVKHQIDVGEESRTVRAADFDGDGDADLLGGMVGDGLYWYENLGPPALQWPRHTIKRGLGPVHGEPFDIDLDGDLDVVMASYRSNGYPKWPGAVTWYENRPGKPFRGHRVAAKYLGAFEAVAGDLDDDGDVDVAATAWGTGSLTWWENQGNDRRWLERELAPGFFRGNSVLLRDLDGDDRLDIVACAEIGNNTLRWWRNEGPPLP